jgi:hypothetical protein
MWKRLTSETFFGREPEYNGHAVFHRQNDCLQGRSKQWNCGIFSFIQPHDFGDFVPLARDDESVIHTRILLNWLKTKQNKAMKRRQYALLR